jgi:1,4-dihydroxy-2-naphthoyl-CoA hydrolase
MPDSLAQHSAFDALYGLEVLGVDDEGARAALDIRRHHLQATGVVHGGVYASIAEAIASFATNWHVTGAGEAALGMSNMTTFLRTATAGRLHAAARPVHRGRTTWVWDVAITDDDGRLCAVSRVMIAVRARRDVPTNNI